MYILLNCIQQEYKIDFIILSIDASIFSNFLILLLTGDSKIDVRLWCNFRRAIHPSNHLSIRALPPVIHSSSVTVTCTFSRRTNPQ